MIHQHVGTPLLRTSEASWLFPVMGVVPSSMSSSSIDDAVSCSGLAPDASPDIGSEWGEHDEEETGAASSALLRVARLRRDPDRFRSEMGAAAYDMVLGEALWTVYLMLGKLSSRILVLTR
ncbi:hypothetical protein [Nocardioides sp. B-3]|uniref:hypothetical protein n=1 Tax=Nocardioides sp. B-3 TaxID=2895565 RepID=UPI0021522647|nr:hypothetical protein [Nocardioides sp. B-3]UUZ58149.1 hypothetical protein LP418_17975 [Nocardioides sp. B-3]